MEKCGGVKNWFKALDNQMGSHYFTKSQWSLPTKDNYNKLQKFGIEYSAFKKEYDEIKKEYYSTRAYFDNTHELMTEVWQFDRAISKERIGNHATPKPIDLCVRAVKSSCPENGIVNDAFLGSGSTLIACEKSNRICYGQELSPEYVDVIVQRFVEYTGNNKIRKNGEDIEW